MAAQILRERTCAPAKQFKRAFTRHAENRRVLRFRPRIAAVSAGVADARKVAA
jgi:hypothetical protein